MLKLRNLDALREQIRQSVRLEEVAQRMYGMKLTSMGGDDFKALCPFHDEKTPSFGIRSSKQMYNCFGCKEGGDLFKFVQKMDTCEHMDAVRKLAEYGGIDLAQFSVPTTAEEKEREKFIRTNERVVAETENSSDYRYTDWIKERRFNADVLKAFGIGYSDSTPDGPTELGFDVPAKWENVIVVPVRDHYGRTVGFRNRLLDKSAKIKVMAEHKGHVLPQPPLYGVFEARKYVRSAGYLILVEGEPDVWQMACHGYRNVAALCGTKLTDESIALLDSIGINRVIVMADNDEPGRKFSRSVAEARIGCKISVKIARLQGDGKDPDEILLATGTDAIDRAIAGATYAFEHVILDMSEQYNLQRASDKLDFLNEIKPKLATAPDIERELAAQLLATMTDMDKDSVVDFFKEATESVVLQNIYGERCVLKRMMQDEFFVGEALTALKTKDFFLSKHRLVFDEISKIYRAQGNTTPEIMSTVMENKYGASARTTVSNVMDASVDATSATFFLDDLKDKSIRREIQDGATDAIRRLGDTKADAKTVIQNLSVQISNAVVSHGQGTTDVSVVVADRMNLMNDRMANPNAIIGLDLGSNWPILNHALHGLQRKRYVILSAPTGVGKTALAGCLAGHIAVNLVVPTLYLTFETGVETLTDRLISNLSGVSSDKTLTGYLEAAEAEAVQDAAARLSASPLVLTERGQAFEECAAIIRNDVLRRGTQVVFVDYIQLMYSTNREISSLRRDQELGHISRCFLELSKELDITLVALAQHNRDGAKQASTNKEAIGESYKIIQDADIGLFMREKSKDEIDADGQDRGTRLMQVAKNRHGRAQQILHIMFDQEVMRMSECTPPSRVNRPSNTDTHAHR